MASASRSGSSAPSPPHASGLVNPSIQNVTPPSTSPPLPTVSGYPVPLPTVSGYAVSLPTVSGYPASLPTVSGYPASLPTVSGYPVPGNASIGAPLYHTAPHSRVHFASSSSSSSATPGNAAPPASLAVSASPAFQAGYLAASKLYRSRQYAHLPACGMRSQQYLRVPPVQPSAPGAATSGTVAAGGSTASDASDQAASSSSDTWECVVVQYPLHMATTRIATVTRSTADLLHKPFDESSSMEFMSTMIPEVCIDDRHGVCLDITCNRHHLDGDTHWRGNLGQYWFYMGSDSNSIESSYCNPAINSGRYSPPVGVPIVFEFDTLRDSTGRCVFQRLSTPSSLFYPESEFATKWIWYVEFVVESNQWEMIQYAGDDKSYSCPYKVLEVGFYSVPRTPLRVVLVGKNEGDYVLDFDNMVLGSETSGDLKFRVRRRPASSNYIEWSFCDTDGSWHSFDKPPGNPFYCEGVALSSVLIENESIARQNGVLQFQRKGDTYMIDFKRKVLRNFNSGEELVVRKQISRKKLLNIPHDWKPMCDSLSYEIIELSESSSPHALAAFWNNRVHRMYRVQNPKLYGCFDAKRKLMLSSLDENLNERVLFLSTPESQVKNICSGNFDKGALMPEGHPIGHGLYFRSTPEAESEELKYGFACKVLIGKTVVGNSDMAYLPMCEGGAVKYNTAVDDVASPTVFVKFDEHSFYPEYIFEYK